MKESSSSNFLVSFAAFIIIIAGLKIASGFIVPFFLALFFAIVCLPLFHFFHQKGIPDWLSLIVIFLLIFVVLGFVGVIISTSVQEFTENLPEYQQNFNNLIHKTFAFANKHGIKLPQKRLINIFNPSFLIRYTATSLKSFGSVMSNSLFTILVVIFILTESATFSKKLAYIAKTPKTVTYFETFLSNVARYMALKTFTSIATGIIVTLMLWIIGVHYAFLWGLSAFLLNYIPTIGSIIAAIPPIILSLIQFGISRTIIVLAGYLIINFAIGNIIEPKIMGKGLGLSTLVVFLSLVFWGWVFGPVGMFLSVPLTMVVKIALDSQENSRWIAVMLDNDVPLNAEKSSTRQK